MQMSGMNVRFVWVVALTMLLGGLLPVVAAPDFGDHNSSTLTTKAWNAMGAGALDEALIYIDKCLELYSAEAKKMQAAMSAYAPAETAAEYWALNDVGTCCFIKGEVMMKKGDTAGARVAYGRVLKEYKYAQCWDTKGWFWKPADAAKQKLVELEFDAE